MWLIYSFLYFSILYILLQIVPIPGIHRAVLIALGHRSTTFLEGRHDHKKTCKEGGGVAKKALG